MLRLRIFGLTLVAFFVTLPAIDAKDDAPKSPAADQPPLTDAGLRSLEHACKVVAAINALDWETARTLSGHVPGLSVLKDDSTRQKDWPGIGAYRASQSVHDGKMLHHRFTYGSSRGTPLELWVMYRLEGTTFTVQSLSVLGW